MIGIISIANDPPMKNTLFLLFLLPLLSFGDDVLPSYCDLNFDLDKIENGKWLSNENGWYIVIPQDGFSGDLSSIVLAYEDSTDQVEAYPFDKVK